MKNLQTLVQTRDMSQDDWLAWRRKGIGGSDVPKILGLSRYGSPITVWLEKTGQVEPEEVGEAAYWGNVMEPVLAQEFTERTGLKVRRRNAILQHPEHSFMLANIDREIVGAFEGLEIKTASEYLRDDWEDDEIPDAYYLQCQHYMAVTGYKRWWIAVLIGGNKFRHKCIERDEETIRVLIRRETEFWAHVEEMVPPPLDGSDASTEIVKSMHPLSNGETVNLPSDALDLIEEFERCKALGKEIEDQKSSAENRIKVLLGDYEVGVIGTRKVTWKNVTSNRFDSTSFKESYPDLYEEFLQPSSSRRFTVK